MTVIRPNSISGVTSITAQVSDITIFGASSGFANITAGNISAAGTITYEDVTNIDSVGVVTARTGIKIGPSAGVAGTFFADGSYITAGIITATSFVGDGSGLTGAGPSLTGSTNNTIVTVTGANAIQGEANLTFDGNNLTQTIDADTEGFKQTAAGNHYIKNIIDANRSGAGGSILALQANWNGKEVSTIKFRTGADTTNKDDGHICFETSSANNIAERLRISSNGSLQVTPEGSTSNPYMLIDTSGDSVRFSAQKASGNNEFRFLTQSSGTVTERLRITSGGRTQVNLPSTSGSSSAISTAQAIVGTKHIHTVYHNFNSTNSGLAINSVIPTNSTGTVDIMGGWANGNGIVFKRFVWCASGATAISQVFSTGASRYGVSVSISTPTMSISGDYVNFNFTFSDSQGSKMEKLKIHFEYHKQFYVI